MHKVYRKIIASLRFIYLLVFFLCTLLLSACWDAIDLEDRAFIIGTGIDLAEETESTKKEPEFAVTNQIIIPANISSTTSKSDSQSGDKPFINITSVGKSIHGLDIELSSKSSKRPYYEHFTLLIISDRIANTKHLLPYLLDTYIRDVNIRRGTKVVISKDPPIKLLDFQTPERTLPVRFMYEMLEKNHRHTGFLESIVLGDIVESHLSNRSYVLPVMELQTEIQNNLGAIFHGEEEKMVGTFNQEELLGLTFMISDASGNIVEFLSKDKMFAFEIVRMKQSSSIDTSNIDELKVTYEIHLEGVIKEAYGEQKFEDATEVEALQKQIEEKVKALIMQTIDKGQKEFNADVFNIWKQLETKHYRTWEQVRDDWEKGKNYFANVTFDIQIDAHIYSMDTSERTK